MKMSCTLLATILVLAIASGCGYSKPANGVTPQITTLAPTSATAGGAAFALVVNGSGFSAGSVVYWNSAPRTTTFGTANQLSAQITAADIATAGTETVYVHTAGGGYGGGTNSNTMNFPVN